MRKIWILLGMILVVVLIVMALTKPDTIEHFIEVKRVARTELSHQLSDSIMLGEHATVVSVEVMGKVNAYVDSHMKVYDCVFFTLGMMRYQKMSVPTTLGVFDKVFFIVDEDKVRKAVSNKIKIPKVDIEELKKELKR